MAMPTSSAPQLRRAKRLSDALKASRQWGPRSRFLARAAAVAIVHPQSVRVECLAEESPVKRGLLGVMRLGTSAMDRADVIIFGGGMVGLALAAALDSSGLSAIVVDPSDPD